MRIATVEPNTCSCQLHVPLAALVIVGHCIAICQPHVSSSIAEYDVCLSVIILIGLTDAGQSPDVA